MTTSAIYESVVRHRRFQPMGHQMRYGVYSVLLDLDEIDGIARVNPIFSRNRWNLVSFHDEDHGPRDGSSLRTWFEDKALSAGVDLTDGSVQLLVFPRILGYTFNPITVWFGRDSDADLRVVMYEVHNTFGHAHSHMAIVPKGVADDALPRHGFDKTLHVSPFFDQIGSYRVTLTPPGDDYRIVIEYLDEDGAKLLTASQDGQRVELTAISLLRQFFTKPLLTMKVMVGIHVEALKIWRKGAKYRPVPEPPARDLEVSYVDMVEAA
ncbi:MAG: DUF1365 domain-containing protein [Acidimicrobiia bacterium]